MMLIQWNELPQEMQNEVVKKYYDILKKKSVALFFTRIFDIVVAFIMLVLLSPLFLVLAVVIKIDSPGPVFYRQVRVTQFGRRFRMFKFRSMVQNSDSGSQVTINHDLRITRVGRVIRRFRLDEMSQLLNVLRGDMTFVGTRPEVPKYVELYTPEMMATLLLPAGITNEACIYFKNEANLLDKTNNIDEVYTDIILPCKMYYNLKSIEKFGMMHCIIIMFKTFFAVVGKEYKDKKFDADAIIAKYADTRSEERFNELHSRTF